MSFDTIGLLAEIVRAVKECGYTQPTPIQEKAIPLILRKRDLLGGAQTGTGKTAGFVLPLLQRVSEKKRSKGPRAPSALILAPTRELAAQLQESIYQYGRFLNLKSVAIFGGVAMKPQIVRLRKGVDILVATPGRLLDHVRQGTVDVGSIEILVLDEADCMLDMGFIHDIRKIMERMPAKRQTLLFSATSSPAIQKLASDILTDPELVQVVPGNTISSQVKQTFYPVDRARKTELLSHLISSNSWEQVLVFTRTKRGADTLSRKLEQEGIQSAAIHGDKKQGARTKALANFKRGQTRVLVATDIAARGLDISQLSHVVNFELPVVPSDYIHRIGRTGRGGKEGEALSLVCIDEKGLLRDIEKLTKKRFESVVVPGFEVDESVKAEPIRRRGSRPKSPTSRGRRATGSGKRAPGRLKRAKTAARSARPKMKERRR